MSRQLNDQTLAALIALGAIAGATDEFVQEFGNIVLCQVNEPDLRRALQFVLERDGGDHFLVRVIKNLRRYAGARAPHLQTALDELARATDTDGPGIVSAASVWKRRVA